MSTRLLLDGEDLRTLMLRVRDEMGPDARIVRAERVRTGGIAGFFAKEHYELTVEVPEKPRRRLGRVRPAPPAEASRPEALRGEPVGIEALMAAAEEAERAPVSTASDSFAQVLASVQAMVGPGPADDAGADGPDGAGRTDRSDRADRADRPDGPDGRDGRGGADGAERADGEVDALLRGARPGDGPGWAPESGDGAGDGGWAPAAFPVLPAGAAPEGAPAGVIGAGAAGGAVAGAGVGVAGVGGLETAAPRRAGSPGAEPGGGAVRDATPASDPAAADAQPAPEPDDPARPRSSVAALLELGIPTRLLAGFTDPHAPVALSRLVRTFDRPRGVRLAPGAVVVVAGPAELALRTATQMAHRAGLLPEDVVLAGDIDPVAGHGRRITTAVAAARLRERAAADAPTVVALGVGATGAAAELLAAFAPDEAWAALDARLRGVELRRWLRAVGARREFDAVASLNTFEAQAPGTVLNLGVPVGWVDGLPASPVVWAAVLSERLADDARWD
jgi:hypothetical protein